MNNISLIVPETTFKTHGQPIGQAGREGDNEKENCKQFGHTSPGGHPISGWLCQRMRGHSHIGRVIVGTCLLLSSRGWDSAGPVTAFPAFQGSPLNFT